MGLSDEVEQERHREIKALRRFVGVSLTGAVLLHSALLSVTTAPFWSAKPRPTEVTIVPRRVPPVAAPVKTPVEPPQPPEQSSEPPPLEQPLQSENLPSSDRPSPETQLELPAATASTPEGDPDAMTDESPLVGSGLSPGTGGSSEGIGLNRSNSLIRGSGGGARRGIPGGSTQRSNPGSDPSVATISPTPQPDLTHEEVNARRAVCRRCPAPNYPRTALQANSEGRVQVAVDVDARGRVVAVRLASSSGDQTIDEAVLETVRQRWRFEAISGGAANIPVEVYMTMNGSELNQQAQTWGEQTAVEIPATGFAAPAASPTPTSSLESLPEQPPELESAESQLEQAPPTESPELLNQSLDELVDESTSDSSPEFLNQPLPQPAEAIPEISSPIEQTVAPAASPEIEATEPDWTEPEIPESVESLELLSLPEIGHSKNLDE